jgi:aspartate/methionine/tyrosine aminotransferase
MKDLYSVALNMPRSGIRVLMDLALTIPDAIHLEIGQPNFPTPEHISAAAYQATRQGFTGYAPNAGLLTFREAIVQKVNQENNIQAEINNVIVTTGGMGGLFSTMLAILEPGDEILIPDPGYPNFSMAAQLCYANPICYPLDPVANFVPKMEVLKGLLSERTKAILINSPSNPTGAVLPAEMIAEFVSFANEHDLYLISDECYERIVFESQHISPASIDTENRVISVFSFSKTYAMTGWRVGFVVAPHDIAPVISKLQEPTVACASSISQKAAEAALQGPQDCVLEMVAAYRKRRDLALGVLERHQIHSYIPGGAFYLLVDITKKSQDSDQFARDVLLKQKVAVAPGVTFGQGGSRYVRVSLATDEQSLVNGLEKICTYMES